MTLRSQIAERRAVLPQVPVTPLLGCRGANGLGTELPVFEITRGDDKARVPPWRSTTPWRVDCRDVNSTARQNP